MPVLRSGRWVPTDGQVAAARVSRLMREMGSETLAELRSSSVGDPSGFWEAVVRHLGIEFDPPYRSVLDTGGGIPWARWFDGGGLNLATACVDRWCRDPRDAGRLALVCESEEGGVERLTFADLRSRVESLAAALRADGVRPGDTVALFLPLVADAVITLYAAARIGAIVVPLFSGFSAEAIAGRLRDARVSVVITADGGRRRGRIHPLKETCDEALASCPSVRRVVVARLVGVDVPMVRPRDVSMSGYLARGAGASSAPYPSRSEDPVLLAYTSGTTGQAKGAVHVHGGFTVKVAAEAAFQMDLGPADRLLWVTDMGWIMAPWSIVGAHANGAAVVLCEGAPDWPSDARLWDLVDAERVTALGMSPTLVRSYRLRADAIVRAHERSSLRVLGSAGEPWTEDAYRWYRDVVGEGMLPIINFSGGTEVGTCFLSAHPIEQLSPCSLGGPALGMDIDVLDGAGRPIVGDVGELVCRQPWPGMTRGLWDDPDRYLSTYWSTYPGIWRHGDWARRDDAGEWFLLGRSDDLMKLGGKRLSPAEVESAMVAHPAVADAAAVGVPDDHSGEALWCFWVSSHPHGADEHSVEIAERVERALGRAFRPKRVVRVAELPRTRSGKVLRRELKAIATEQLADETQRPHSPQAAHDSSAG